MIKHCFVRPYVAVDIHDVTKPTIIFSLVPKISWCQSSLFDMPNTSRPLSPGSPVPRPNPVPINVNIDDYINEQFSDFKEVVVQRLNILE